MVPCWLRCSWLAVKHNWARHGGLSLTIAIDLVRFGWYLPVWNMAHLAWWFTVVGNGDFFMASLGMNPGKHWCNCIVSSILKPASSNMILQWFFILLNLVVFLVIFESNDVWLHAAMSLMDRPVNACTSSKWVIRLYDLLAKLAQKRCTCLELSQWYFNQFLPNIYW